MKKIMLKKPNSFNPFGSELGLMVGKLLSDPCPAVKEDSCKFIILMSEHIGKHIGPHSRQIVQSLCANLTHQHNKIRKITLTVLHS